MREVQRQSPEVPGEGRLNWTAAAPTPGQFLGAGDSDSDGMPDSWEQENGTFVFVPDAGDDPDGDGLTNLQEYLAGTHPHNPASVLRIEQITRNSDSVTLQFLAASNRTYSVLSKSTLDGVLWLKVTDLPAHPTYRMVNVTNFTPGVASRFYRLVTPAQP